MTFYRLGFLCSLFLVFFTLENTIAQDQSLRDSLLQVLGTDITAQEKVNTYNALANYYKYIDPTQVEQYVNPSIEIATKINYSEGLSDAYYLKGAIYIRAGEYDKTLELLDSAVLYANKTNYLKGLGGAYNGIGFIAWRKGQYEQALQYFNKALEMRQKIGIKQDIISTNLNIGIIHVEQSNFQKALDYYNHTLELAIEIDDKYSISTLYNNIGNVYNFMDDYPRAIQQFELSLDMRKEINYEDGVAECYLNLGRSYEEQGNYALGLETYLNALKIYKGLEYESRIAMTQGNIGVIYGKLENYESAIEYLKKSLLTHERLGNSQEAALDQNNLAYAHEKLGNQKQALNLYTKALRTARNINAPRIIVQINQGLSEYYLSLQDYEKAQFHAKETISVAKELGMREDVSEGYISSGKIYLKQQNYAQAIKALNKGSSVANEISSILNIRIANELLSQAYQALGNYHMAYDAHVLFKQMADSLNNQAITKKITLLEANYAFDQEKDSIAFEQEKERLAFNAEIEKGETTQRATLVGLGLAILVIAVLFMFFNQKKKANLALSELNKEIQNQNAEIKSQRDHLDDLNHTKTKFFSIVSHDLRGPMAAFQSLSDIMDYNLKLKNYNELSEVTEEVVQRSKQVSLLLDNLLNWAVSEEGHFPYHPEAINVENAINEVETIHQPLAAYKGINLKTEVNTSHIVFADRNSYMTILRNLVSNAIKFTAQGGKVSISTEQQDGNIIMKVSDTGVGMSEERYKKLFVLKEKDSSSGTSGEKGVGLGLQLVHDFVQMNKGKMDVVSEEGKGTTFIVFLPVFSNTPVVA